MNSTHTRREMLKATAVGAAGIVLSPLLSMCTNFPENSGSKKNVLFFTDSEDFPHPVVTRKSPDELAFAEKIFKDLGEKAGYQVTVSKDGRLFNPDQIGQFDVFAFYTTGDLTKPPGTKYKSDQTPAMTPAGKAALLQAIHNGKGFLGLHCASDTFHSPGYAATPGHSFAHPLAGNNVVDPYIAMLGGEFYAHGSQQNATIHAGSHTFPQLADEPDFTITEEWYSLYNFAPDLHVILVQDTTTMKVDDKGQREWQYQRPPYPETWARRHGQGRVFYSSMGHREDVWTSALYQKILLAGLAWTSGQVRADLPPNLAQACPEMMKISAQS